MRIGGPSGDQAIHVSLKMMPLSPGSGMYLRHSESNPPFDTDSSYAYGQRVALPPDYISGTKTMKILDFGVLLSTEGSISSKGVVSRTHREPSLVLGGGAFESDVTTKLPYTYTT